MSSFSYKEYTGGVFFFSWVTPNMFFCAESLFYLLLGKELIISLELPFLHIFFKKMAYLLLPFCQWWCSVFFFYSLSRKRAISSNNWCIILFSFFCIEVCADLWRHSLSGFSSKVPTIRNLGLKVFSPPNSLLDSAEVTFDTGQISRNRIDICISY